MFFIHENSWKQSSMMTSYLQSTLGFELGCSHTLIAADGTRYSIHH